MNEWLRKKEVCEDRRMLLYIASFLASIILIGTGLCVAVYFILKV
uniref:Uncharacterized protein n=1 Tax=viral metagenome TaxID=1070528 RepID=A0A6M3JAK2_9ZZZZ